MNTTVIVVTLNRPDCVFECLTCLFAQTPKPDQIIVVDASKDDRTQRVTAGFPSVIYLRNQNGFGRMTASRNIGLAVATGEIIAFVDDDAYARPGWLANLLATYTDQKIGAVGGRACNGVRGEENDGVDSVGRLYGNGKLVGNFAADTGKTIDVDHIMGCNMSYRREVIAELGGFREDYPGISGVREDSDMCVRVKNLGYRILFNPASIVDHVGAPQAVGKRFDHRYEFYIQRNHMALLIRNFGPTSAIFWKYVLFSFKETTVGFLRRVGGALLKVGAISLGTIVGVASGLKLLMSKSKAPQRYDAEANALREKLKAPATKSVSPAAAHEEQLVTAGK